MHTIVCKSQFEGNSISSQRPFFAFVFDRGCIVCCALNTQGYQCMQKF